MILYKNLPFFHIHLCSCRWDECASTMYYTPVYEMLVDHLATAKPLKWTRKRARKNNRQLKYYKTDRYVIAKPTVKKKYEISFQINVLN